MNVFGSQKGTFPKTLQHWFSGCSVHRSAQILDNKTNFRSDQVYVKVHQYLKGYRMLHIYRKLENRLYHGGTKRKIFLNISPNKFKIDDPRIVLSR